MATLLLAVTGSIAAYKAADLASKLSQAGHSVHVVMSAAARELVGPSTFLNVTGNPVFTSLWDAESQTRHIQLTDAAELAILAPATANSLAKLALGLADEVVSTTLLALDCPLLICPAMNVRMWRNPTVQRNLATLRSLGHEVLTPGSGHLACGHVGPGRLAEPAEIAAAVESLLASPRSPRPAGSASPGDASSDDVSPELLERLAGPWRLTGEVLGRPVRQAVLGELVLAGSFVRLHFLPSETPGSDGRPYEAIATLGRAGQGYVMHLADVFGGEPAQVNGSGELLDPNTLVFHFAYPEGAVRTSYRWLAAERAWELAFERESAEGATWELFARKRLERP